MPELSCLNCYFDGIQEICNKCESWSYWHPGWLPEELPEYEKNIKK